MENTVGSRYYKNEQKRAAQVQERISKMKARLITVTASEKVAALQKVSNLSCFGFKIWQCTSRVQIYSKASVVFF